MATTTATQATLDTLAAEVAAAYGIAVGATIAVAGGYASAKVTAITMYRGDVRIATLRGEWKTSYSLSEVVYA